MYLALNTEFASGNQTYFAEISDTNKRKQSDNEEGTPKKKKKTGSKNSKITDFVKWKMCSEIFDDISSHTNQIFQHYQLFF